MKRKVIIDCDPGLDDALALMIATASEDIEIIGVTTIGGNSSIENTTQNALNLMYLYGQGDVPIAKGVSNPIVGKTRSGAHVHGKTGIANITLKESPHKIHELVAHEFMYKEIMNSKEKVTIIATGPLTNVGLLLTIYPDVVRNIEVISIMGGTTKVGNVTSVSEANITNDPEAAKIVVNSGANIFMSGLNLTYRGQIYPEEFDEIEELGGEIPKIAADLFRYHFRSYEKMDGFRGDPTHDSTAVAYVIKPDIIKAIKRNVVIDLSGKYSRGQTIVDIHEVTGRQANVNVGMDIDRDEFFKLIYDSAKYHRDRK